MSICLHWPFPALLSESWARGTVGVAQPAGTNVAASSRFIWCPCATRSIAFAGFVCSPPRFIGIAFGLGRPTISAALLKSCGKW